MKYPKGLFNFLFLAFFVTGLPTNAMAHTGVGVAGVGAWMICGV